MKLIDRLIERIADRVADRVAAKSRATIDFRPGALQYALDKDKARERERQREFVRNLDKLAKALNPKLIAQLAERGTREHDHHRR